jgi:hypothetical protein
MLAQAQTLQIKNEIKFVYKKKQQLNKSFVMYICQVQTHGHATG